jgi:hypothetical protein
MELYVEPPGGRVRPLTSHDEGQLVLGEPVEELIFIERGPFSRGDVLELPTAFGQPV